MNCLAALKTFLFKNLKTVKIILILMYLAGFIGMQLETTRPYFLYLTPFNIFTSTILILIFHENWQAKTWPKFIFVIIAGISIEIIGVKTGKVFGNYNYGNTLGVKIFSVPLSIGLNWLLLTYLTGYFVQKTIATIIPNYIILALIGAFLMTAFDVIIEPIAVYFDFWHWQSGTIPLQNYLAWFIVSFLFLLFLHFKKTNTENKIAFLLLTLQLLFFFFHNIALIISE
jgi:bisanhydrobacterioruberin hydratase